MSEHYPVLIVAVPLLAAALCMLVRNAVAARFIAGLASLACFYMVAQMLGRVFAEGTQSYHLGAWPPPLGIEYRYDRLNTFVALIVSMIATIVVPFGQSPSGSLIPRGKQNLVYSAYLLCTAGMLGMCVTGDLFNVYVFLEISSLSAYTLVALGPERRALMAAYSYLIMGTIGGMFFLIGIGLLYQMTGTLNMADLALRLGEVTGGRTISVAFSILLVGLSIKLAVFPLHQWLPNAYTFSPPKISAFLAATATKVAYYVILRVVFTIFGREFSFDHMQLHYLLLPLSLMAMFGASIAAVYQSNIKRLLAYSSIAQIGYMTLGLSFNSVSGLTGGIVHLFNHAMMKGGLFLVVACIALRIGSSKIEDMRGLGRRMPFTMAAFVVGGLSLVGVPGTVGFVSKWYLIQAALEKEWYFVAVLALMSSLIAMLYVWRVIEVAYFGKPGVDAPARDVSPAPLSMLVPVWLLIGASIYFGLFTEHTVTVAQAAAEQLLGVTP